MKPPAKKPLPRRPAQVSFGINVPVTTQTQIDEWRGVIPGVPSRGTVVTQLVAHGVKTGFTKL